MYKPSKPSTTTLTGVETYEGERIEEMISRMINNKEPISDRAPRYYTDRKQGVLPEFNIRTDKWDIAIEATSKLPEFKAAERASKEKKLGEKAKEGMDKESKQENNPKGGETDGTGQGK